MPNERLLDDFLNARISPDDYLSSQSIRQPAQRPGGALSSAPLDDFLNGRITPDDYLSAQKADAQGASALARKQPPDEPAQRGLFAEAASSLGAGVVATGESLAAAGEMVGIPGAAQTREFLKGVGESEALRRPDYLTGPDTILDRPERLADWRWWVRNVGENLPNMAFMMAPGGAALKGAQALGWGLKAQRAAGIAGAVSGSFPLEAGAAYGQAKDEMTREGRFDGATIERIATLEGLSVGAVNAVLEVLPFDNLFLRQAGADRLVKRIVRQAMLEGGTETAQEAVNILAEQMGHQPDFSLKQAIGRALEAGLTGAVLGGGAGATIGTAVHKKNAKQYNNLADKLRLRPEIYAMKDAGLSDGEITTAVSERLEQVRLAQQDARSAQDSPLVASAQAATDTGNAGQEDKPTATPKPFVLPDIDAAEMTSYVLYAGKNPRYKPPPGIGSRFAAPAKDRILAAFGMRPPSAPADTDTRPSSSTSGGMVAGAQSVTDIGAEPGRWALMEEEARAEREKQNRNAGANMLAEAVLEEQAETPQAPRRDFDAVLGDLTPEGQAQAAAALEARRQAQAEEEESDLAEQRVEREEGDVQSGFPTATDPTLPPEPPQAPQAAEAPAAGNTSPLAAFLAEYLSRYETPAGQPARLDEANAFARDFARAHPDEARAIAGNIRDNADVLAAGPSGLHPDRYRSIAVTLEETAVEKDEDAAPAISQKLSDARQALSASPDALTDGEIKVLEAAAASPGALTETQTLAKAKKERAKSRPKAQPPASVQSLTGKAPDPATASAPMPLSYEEFAKKYESTFKQWNQYTPDQAGFKIYAEEMATLADAYPEHLKRFEKEGEKAPTPTEKPTEDARVVHDREEAKRLIKLNLKKIQELPQNKRAGTVANSYYDSIKNNVNDLRKLGGVDDEALGAIRKSGLYDDDSLRKLIPERAPAETTESTRHRIRLLSDQGMNAREIAESLDLDPDAVIGMMVGDYFGEKPETPPPAKQTHTTTVEAPSKGEIVQPGAKLGAGISDTNKAFVENKIREFGTVEAVSRFYAGKDAVSDYARSVAGKILGATKSPAGWAKQKPDAPDEVGTQSGATQTRPTFSRSDLVAGFEINIPAHPKEVKGESQAAKQSANAATIAFQRTTPAQGTPERASLEQARTEDRKKDDELFERAMAVRRKIYSQRPGAAAQEAMRKRLQKVDDEIAAAKKESQARTDRSFLALLEDAIEKPQSRAQGIAARMKWDEIQGRPAEERNAQYEELRREIEREAEPFPTQDREAIVTDAVSMLASYPLSDTYQVKTYVPQVAARIAADRWKAEMSEEIDGMDLSDGQKRTYKDKIQNVSIHDRHIAERILQDALVVDQGVKEKAKAEKQEAETKARKIEERKKRVEAGNGGFSPAAKSLPAGEIYEGDEAVREAMESALGRKLNNDEYAIMRLATRQTWRFDGRDKDISLGVDFLDAVRNSVVFPKKAREQISAFLVEDYGIVDAEPQSVPAIKTVSGKQVYSNMDTFALDDESRPNLAGFYSDNGDLVATDGHRLLIHYGAAGDLKNETIFRLEKNGVLKEVDATFPDYKRVLPQDRREDEKVKIDADQATKLVARIKAVAKRNLLTPSSSERTLQEYPLMLGDVGLNGWYLSDILTGVLKTGAERISISVPENDRTTFLLEGFKGKDLVSRAVVMPIRGMPSYAFHLDLTTGKAKQEPVAKETTKPEGPEPEAEKPAKEDKKAEEIQDFGEKIGGARKDTYSRLKEDISNITSESLKSEPLSKVWPEPDYQKMIDEGVNAKAVGFVRALRDTVPDKPRKAWKVARWAEEVKSVADLADIAISSEGSLEAFAKQAKKMQSGGVIEKIANNAMLYDTFGHSKSLKGVRLVFATWSEKIDGEWIERKKWVVERDRSGKNTFSSWPQRLGIGDTKEEAVGSFRGKYDAIGATPREADGAKKFIIYEYRDKAKPGHFIGVKRGRAYIDLVKFATPEEARKYREENIPALEDKLALAVSVPRERAATNRERVGKQNRNGDVTTDMFSRTFGFRGGEFGNWVNAEERQWNLNNAYDALYDLSLVLDIPPQAISLNGELSIAFGARGRGGKDAPSAHYEPDRIVINLTKRSGPGSLAHEWFHAVDNYFSRQRGAKDGFISEKPFRMGPNDQTRQEVIEAIGKLNAAVDATGIKARSEMLDEFKGKKYWSDRAEFTARAFESYIIDKLAGYDTINDYLANINSLDAYAEAMIEGMANGKQAIDIYPYLLQNEIKPVVAAFDSLFATIKTRPTDKGVAMYSRANRLEFMKNSKVRHIVYHATSADINEFDTQRGDLGAHFGTKEQASNVAMRRLGGGEGVRVMPVYVNITNPLRLKDVGTFHADGIAPQLEKIGLLPKGEGRRIVREIDNNWRLREKYDPVLRDLIIGAGYDGVVYKNTAPGEGPGDSYIVFRPEQIKSAIGNVGTFSKDSPDIRYARGTDAAGGAMTRAELEDYARQLMGDAPNQPRLVVVEEASELPFDALEDAKGVYVNGTMYLVAEQIALPEDANETIFHEFVGHFGLQGFFGDRIRPALDRIHVHNPLVRQYTNEWLKNNRDFQERHNLSDLDYHYRAIEEAMARMAQENKPFTFAKRLLSTVQTLLRNVGMMRLADTLEAKTDAEALTMLHKARLYIEKGKTVGDKIPEPLYPYFMTAWHGSPHTFDRFSKDKIGTGEGAQAYGYGLYFAGRREVAEYYREELSRGIGGLRVGNNIKKFHEEIRDFFSEYYPSMTRDQIVRWIDRYAYRIQPLAQRYYQSMPEGTAQKDAAPLLNVAIDRFTKDHEDALYADDKDDAENDVISARIAKRTLEKEIYEIDPRKGRLYQVELAPADDEYLLWDKPLSEQSEKVKAILGNAMNPSVDETRKIDVIDNYTGWAEEHGYPEPTGEDLYDEFYAETMGAKAASDYLHSLGIRGIKYLDGSSRRGGRAVWKPDANQSGYHALTQGVAENYLESSAGNLILAIRKLKADAQASGAKQYADAAKALENKDLEHRLDYNYVIFSEDDVSVTERYSVADDRATIEENWPDEPPDISRPEWESALERYEQHTSTAALMKHPDYKAAKSGDLEAARRIADKFFKEGKLSGLVDNAPAGAPIIVVPVAAIEAAGINKLPYALAEKIQDYTDWRIEEEIRQANKPKRTGKGHLYRLLNQPEFAGPVIPGAYYVIVDDVGSSGATFMNLAGHIDAGGGKILGLQAFGSGRSGPHIKPLDNVLKKLQDAYTWKLKDVIRQLFGGEIHERQLTSPEVSALVSHAKGILERGGTRGTGSGNGPVRGKYAQTESEREVRVGSPERTRLTEDSLNAPPAAPPPSSADKNNRYDAAPAQKAAGRDRARLGAVELRDLTRDLASRIKGISVVEPTPGELWIQTKAGHRVRLTEAYYIDPDEAILRVDYQATNRHEPFSGMVIAGKYTRGEITLVRSRAGLWTLTHEFYHFLEDIGAIANADKVLLNNKITSLIAKDPKQYAYLKGRSNAEARAEWAGRTLAGVYDAQTPTGKILQKMRDIIDRIVNALGIRTAGGVIRDIRTGQIFEAEEIAANENRRIDAADLYSAMRQGAEPKKTIIAYKLFRVMKTRPGEIFPLFIGKNKPTPMETWIQAEFLPTKGFAARPGWHVGRTPQADHLMKKDGTLPQNRVWAEVEIPADVDWQPEADRQPTRDIQGKPPAGGFYRFRRPVNQGGEWLIAGAMKVNRILSAEEVEQARSRGPDQYALAEDVWQGRVAQPVGRMVAQGVESLIGRGAAGADRMSGWETFKRHWQEFWQPFSSLEGGGTALAARYRAMGDVAKATRFIQDLYGKLSAFPDDVRRDMFWYLDGQIPMDALPEEARDLARTIRERTDTIGEMLVDRGILSEETFAAHQGQYIHYMYAKHVLGEDRPVFLTGTGKLNLTYTKQRNPNLTLQQRKELGLIEDASVAVPVGMGKALTDIAKWDYLASIAANPDWVWQPSVVAVPIGKPLARPVEGRDRRNVRMGIGRLVEEVRTYDAMMSRHPTPEIEEVHRILTDALEQAQEETANAPGNFVQLPTAKTYGPLAGAYVRKPIADDLKPVLDVAADRGRLFNTILEIERQGMALFKMGKVALNLPTAVRNMVSNIIQNNMRGRSLSQIPGDIVAGCESLKAKDAYYEEAFGMGLFHTNWFVTEINDVLDEFRKVQSGRIDQILIALKNLAKYYGRIDDVNKHAIFVQMRKAGHSVDEAALEAMKWGMDYSLTSRSIKGLRQTITPFATYMYKIAPLIAESLKKRPWVLAKFGLIYPAAKALAMGLHGMDDDDWEDLEKQLPSYIKKSGSMMILPWRSDKGQWQWVNLEYFFPWGNYLNIFRDVSKADLGESLRDLGVSNPFLSMFYTGLSAREDQPPLHSYFGTPIYNELDPPPVKAAKLLEFMANTWMPSMLTRQGAIGYTGKMLAGGEDRWGREVSFGQALGRWFGLNIVSVSPEQTRAQAAVKIQDLRKELARIEADPSRSSEEKGAYLQRMNERLGRIAEESPAAVLPITKARGRDPVYDALKDMAARGVLHTGPPSRAVEIGGIPRKMSLEQYRSYLEKSSELARRRLSVVMEGPAWEAMSDRRRSEVVSGIVSNARKGVRQRIKIDIARSERERSGSAAARMQ